MSGYKRTSGRYEVRWEPDDQQLALDALVAVDGTGVSGASDLPDDDGLVDLTDQPDVQTTVREEYDRLTTDSSGQTSGQ